MINSNLIAGNKIPKWDIKNSDDLDIIIDNLENKSQMNERLASLEEAKKSRIMAGVCNVCRCVKCLCHEGQI